MKIGDEPKRPEMSEVVADWLCARFGDDGSWAIPSAESLRGDAPPDVLAFLEAYARWRDEHEVWAVQQPLNFDPTSFRWRMFGGEWLGGYASVLMESEHHDGRTCVSLLGCVQRAVERGAGFDELQALAAHIYKWRGIQRRSDADLASALMAAAAGDES